MFPILYSYETESGQISPLPTSPFLIPAILVYGFCALFSRSRRSRRYRLSSNFNQAEYELNKRLYYQIKPKVLQGAELTLSEHNLWYNILPYPSWAKSGEHWSY
jgi:hypothetical protein